MTYEYECEKCGHKWEEVHLSKDRDKPLSLPCPSCKKRGGIRRELYSPPVQYDGVKSLAQRTHPDLRERLKSMDENFSTKYRKTTIQYD